MVSWLARMGSVVRLAGFVGGVRVVSGVWLVGCWGYRCLLGCSVCSRAFVAYIFDGANMGVRIMRGALSVFQNCLFEAHSV